jgi:hypothetical protein
MLIRLLPAELLDSQPGRIQNPIGIHIHNSKVRLCETRRIRSIWQPGTLSDACDGIYVVDATELFHRGFEALELRFPVRDIDLDGPGYPAVLVQFIGEGLGAFNVAVCNEDFCSAWLLG